MSIRQSKAIPATQEPFGVSHALPKERTYLGWTTKLLGILWHLISALAKFSDRISPCQPASKLRSGNWALIGSAKPSFFASGTTESVGIGDDVVVNS